MSSVAIQRYRPADYLALERASEVKHEFFDGERFLMARGTVEHSQVASNVIRALGNSLADSLCRMHTSDITPTENFFRLPLL